RRTGENARRVEDRQFGVCLTYEQRNFGASERDGIAAVARQIVNHALEIRARSWLEASAHQFIVNDPIDALTLIWARNPMLNAGCSELGLIDGSLHQKART